MSGASALVSQVGSNPAGMAAARVAEQVRHALGFAEDGNSKRVEQADRLILKPADMRSRLNLGRLWFYGGDCRPLHADNESWRGLDADVRPRHRVRAAGGNFRGKWPLTAAGS